MGTLLALDWGQKKVGFATSDKEGIVVTPRRSFKRKKIAREHIWQLTPEDISEIHSLLKEYEVDSLVLGLPLTTHGVRGEAAIKAESLAKTLQETFHVKVELVDEFLSSWEARGSSNEDAEAAATLLRDYFTMKQRHSNRKGTVHLGKVLGLFFIVTLIFGAVATFRFRSFSLLPASPGGAEFILDVPPDSNFYKIKQSLELQGIPIDPIAFKIWVRIHRADQRLRIGEYRLMKSWSPHRILNEVLSGKPILRRFIVREGANLYDIKNEWALVRPQWNQSNIENIFSDAELLKRMQVPRSSLGRKRTLEGFLFPETYSFQKYDSPRKIIEAMLDQFDKRALPLLKSHPLGQTEEGRYRLLILASMVEKESSIVEEQPLIASVFWNRLAKRMRMQSDPTTIYGLMPGFNGNITKANLLSPTPYNTYTLPELPVGPIANPGETAIRAVLQPATSDYLFFVSKNDGSHVFSSDYKTHSKYVDSYQRAGSKLKNKVKRKN